MVTKDCPKGDYFDVCIIGAGPAALACLSAISEPYSVDYLGGHQVERALHSIGLHQKRRVCVIDPSSGWLQGWKSNFDTLRIQHLRSPALAHPDMFDPHALLAFACRRGRDRDELFESGCWDRKDLLGLGQTQVGLWKLPSTKLFADFCDELVAELPHTFHRGKVVDIDDSRDGMYQISWNEPSSKKRYTFARSVILATGITGHTVVPPDLEHCPKVVPWNAQNAFPSPALTEQNKQRILVVGGGLTAVQAALRVAQDNHECVLCSRRPLQEKHFDIPVEWFDLRKTNKHLSEIYHCDMEERMKQLKKARDGGSVPSMYMKLLEKYKGNLECCVGNVEYMAGDNVDDDQNETEKVTIAINGVPFHFDKVIVACGIKPDCSTNPVIANVLSKWPIQTHHGFPELTPDLHWSKSRKSLFVVGAMASLQVGPDAGNLMGMRRAATLVANALECRGWLREKALANPYMALQDSSDSDSDSDTESDCEDVEISKMAIFDKSNPIGIDSDSDTDLEDPRLDFSTCASDNGSESYVDPLDN